MITGGGGIKMKNSLHITEGVESLWHYHLSEDGVNSVALCGAHTMDTSLRLDMWGYKGQLKEKYCSKCEEIAKTKMKVEV